MDCGGMDTTPPEYPSASTCSSMIRPLLEFSGTDIAPVGPMPFPVISTVIAPPYSELAGVELANFTGIRWMLPARWLMYA